MQVVKKPGEGLSRNYGVKVPAKELGAALDARIAEILPTLNLKGFRPGKVPQAHVRRLYGKALMGEVIEKTLSETSQKVLADNKLRIAMQPDLKPVSDMAQVIAGREDLTYDLEVEVMPEFDPIDVAKLKLTRLVYAPPQAELDEAMAELVAQNRTYEPRAGKGAKAKQGDQLAIDFIGRINGEPFEGGAANDAELVLGTGQFIPGFEGQLEGAAAGDDVVVKVAFPTDYTAERLAGKSAVFEVKVKAVRAPKAAKADDALAQRLGLTDLAALKAAVRQSIEGRYQEASRFKLKRALLDALDGKHRIPLPPRMVEAEFEGIWSQVEKDKSEGQDSPEDAGKSDEELRGDYHQIAERRVRLGLVLAEIGRRENVTVTDAELSDAMRTEAMRYGDQAQQMFDLLRQNANAQTQIRAPLYEEKVVDLILGRATVKERAVSKEELLKEDDLPEGFGHAHDHDHAGHHHHEHAHDDAHGAVKAKARTPVKAAAKTKTAKSLAPQSAKVRAPATLKAAKPKAAKPKASKPKA
jgi:trigger factor